MQTSFTDLILSAAIVSLTGDVSAHMWWSPKQFFRFVTLKYGVTLSVTAPGYELVPPSSYRNLTLLREHISLWRAGMVRLERLSASEFDRIRSERETPKREDPERKCGARAKLSGRKRLRSIATVGVKCKGQIHTPDIIDNSDVEAD